jgi:DNA-binding NtrC family response regulator
VRELENALEYAISVCEGQTIHTTDLPIEIERFYADRDGDFGALLTPAAAVDSRPSDVPLIAEPAGAAGSGLTSAEADEIESIRKALHETKYNRGLAAERLGMSRTTLWRKMKQYRL